MRDLCYIPEQAAVATGEGTYNNHYEVTQSIDLFSHINLSFELLHPKDCKGIQEENIAMLQLKGITLRAFAGQPIYLSRRQYSKGHPLLPC
jgi:hypothetical protein